MSNQLIFIDSNLTDYQSLINDLPDDSQWAVINFEQNGIEQILQVTSNFSNLGAIQIFSHGSAGALQLGSTSLSLKNIEQYQQQLNRIGQSLSDTGDILLYGCNVAEGDVGEDFVNRLANYTQADIAASTDLTGAEPQDGDWDLEYSKGFIATRKLVLDEYRYSLATLYSDDFSNLNSWVNKNGNWAISDGTLTVNYNISNGGATQPQADIVLSTTLQPAGDYIASVDFVRTNDIYHNDYFQALAQFVIWQDTSHKMTFSIGGGGFSNWGGEQSTINVGVESWTGSWSNVFSETFSYTWNPDVVQTASLKKEGNTYSFYVNDTLLYSAFEDTYLNGNGAIGLHSYGAKTYDNFRIEGITSTSTNSLVAHYSFDGDAQDSSGYNNHGTIHGDTAYSLAGVDGQSLQFSSLDQYVSVGTSIPLANNFSFSGWFNHSSASTSIWNAFFHTKGGYAEEGGNALGMMYNEQDNIIRIYDGGNNGFGIRDISFQPTPDTWFNLTATYNGQAIKTYVDGALIDEFQYSGGLESTTPLVIGASYNDATDNLAYTWQGSIDEVKIYDRALSAPEIQQQYELIVPDILNQAPVVNAPILDVSYDTETVISFTYSIPEGTFTDPDGDNLTYSATLADGSVLPEWLVFNPYTPSVFATINPDYVGSYDVQITATDAGGLSVSDTFALDIEPIPIDVPEGQKIDIHHQGKTYTVPLLLSSDSNYLSLSNFFVLNESGKYANVDDYTTAYLAATSVALQEVLTLSLNNTDLPSTIQDFSNDAEEFQGYVTKITELGILYDVALNSAAAVVGKASPTAIASAFIDASVDILSAAPQLYILKLFENLFSDLSNKFLSTLTYAEQHTPLNLYTGGFDATEVRELFESQTVALELSQSLVPMFGDYAVAIGGNAVNEAYLEIISDTVNVLSGVADIKQTKVFGFSADSLSYLNTILSLEDRQDLVTAFKSFGEILIEMNVSAHNILELDSLFSLASLSNISQAIGGSDLSGQLDGSVSDGYISGASIYVDSNGNGIADAGENTGVITDSAGDYTLDNYLGGTIIAVGGTNTDTGLANELILKAPTNSGVVTPITTLIQEYQDRNNSSIEEAETAVQVALGISSDVDLTQFDALAQETSAGIEVQKVAAQLATLGTLAQESGASFGSIIERLSNAVSNVQDISLNNAESLKSVLDNSLNLSIIDSISALNVEIESASSFSDITQAQLKLSNFSLGQSYYNEQVQKLYIAYFGRAADPGGLAFYADSLNASQTTIEAIASSFASSAEAQRVISLSVNDFLAAMYQQAFARVYTPSIEGTFWADAINTGQTTKELAMVQILLGARGQDSTVVSNKVEVAVAFTTEIEAQGATYAGTEAAALAKPLLDNVSYDSSTVTSSINEVAATVREILALSEQSNDSNTVTLSSEGTFSLSFYLGSSLAADTLTVLTKNGDTPITLSFEGSDRLTSDGDRGILLGGNGDDVYTIGSIGQYAIFDSAGNDTLIIPTAYDNIGSYTLNGGEDLILYGITAGQDWGLLLPDWKNIEHKIETFILLDANYSYNDLVFGVNTDGGPDVPDSYAEAYVGISSFNVDPHIALFEYLGSLDATNYSNVMGNVDTTELIGSDHLIDYLL